MNEQTKTDPARRPSRRPRPLIIAVIVLGIIAAVSVALRVTGRGGATHSSLTPATAIQIPKSSSGTEAPPAASNQASASGEQAPAGADKPKPNTPVEWNGDVHRFFPLAPGNTWTYRGRNTRGPEEFEYIWHVSQRASQPQGGTLYLVELYRNGEYRDRFFFGSDSTGLYRYSSPDGGPGIVIRYPPVAGTSWLAGTHEIRILGTAEVTTPAGHFTNAVQVCSQRSGKPGDAFWTAAYEYFVPGVGRVVSESFAHHDGKTDTLRAELAGFAVRSE